MSIYSFQSIEPPLKESQLIFFILFFIIFLHITQTSISQTLDPKKINNFCSVNLHIVTHLHFLAQQTANW